MSAKARTWWGVAGVAALAALWWASGRFVPGAQQRTFRERIARLDTASITGFTLVPAPYRQHPEMRFERQPGGWLVTSAGYRTPADKRTMDDLLVALGDLRVLRVVGRYDAVKDNYLLADSTADHLLLDTPEGALDLAVGRTIDGEEIATAVRPGDDAEVYAVPGLLGLLVDKGYMDWIPKPVVNGDPRNWRRLTFVFPGSQGYILERRGDHWYIGDQPTDSIKVAKYLRNLAHHSGSALANPADTLDAVLVYNLIVEDTTRAEPVMFGIFQSGDRVIARSTLAPRDIVMAIDPRTEVPRIFRPPSAFLPDPPADAAPAVNR